MKFNSQISTSRLQSERLLVLGLKKETADMYYRFYNENTFEINPTWETIWEYRNDYKKFIPAWSLHRLLCLLPKRVQVYDEVWKFKRNLYLSIDEDFNIRYEENVDEPCFDKIFWAYDIYLNCVDAIEWLIKEGYFPKEYLV